MEKLRIIAEMPAGPMMPTIIWSLTELTKAGQLERSEGTWGRYRRG
ncbi:MAG: hypothetical protein WKF73_09835 [Nocardioidaceae bacterium]